MEPNNNSKAHWTDRMVRKEVELGCPLEEAIRRLVEEGRSWEGVAEGLDISRVTLQDWRRRLGIRKQAVLR